MHLDRRRVVAALLAVAAILVLSACGAGAGGKVYSASATEACLTQTGARVDASGADSIAQGASGGGAEVSIDGKIFNIAFGKAVSEAKSILDSYNAAGGNTSLYRVGSAVLSWDDDPGSVKQTVDGCLR